MQTTKFNIELNQIEIQYIIDTFSKVTYQEFLEAPQNIKNQIINDALDVLLCIKTVKRLPKIPLKIYIKQNFKVPIKCSTKVPKNKMPKELEKRCSKFPCKTLFAIQRYDSQNDSFILKHILNKEV